MNIITYITGTLFILEIIYGLFMFTNKLRFNHYITLWLFRKIPFYRKMWILFSLPSMYLLNFFNVWDNKDDLFAFKFKGKIYCRRSIHPFTLGVWSVVEENEKEFFNFIKKYAEKHHFLLLEDKLFDELKKGNIKSEKDLVLKSL